MQSNGNGARILCVSLMPDGSTQRKQCDYASDIGEMLRSASISWVNCTLSDVKQEAPALAEQLGFGASMLQSLLSGSMSAYEDFEVELGLLLPAVHVHGLEVEINPLLVLVRKGVVLTMHSEHITRLLLFARYAETFMRKIRSDMPLNDQTTVVLTRILDENNMKNFEGLRIIEEKGDEIGKYLIDATTPSKQLGPDIYAMKHALIVYLNSLWASLDVMHSLRYGDAELITDNNRLLQRLGMLGEDISRQISLSEHMSEVLASGLEVLQTIYNNQLQALNNRLAFVTTWLTILGTAVLVPNTLATIFGNSAFGMTQKDIGGYAALLVVSTALATAAAYMFFKKSGWLPMKVD
jgi:magnesium transporter